MNPSVDYYTLLGLNPEASSGEVKKAFHRLALQHHPDRNPENPDAAERFREINEAYQVLSDPDRRKRYDQQQHNFIFETEAVAPYLHAETDRTAIKLNEEVQLTYAYYGEGRFFKKPLLHGWMITSGPLVEYRLVFRNNVKLKETVLHYTLSPIRIGSLEIPSAKISFKQIPYLSNRIQVQVENNSCFFTTGNDAGEHPLKIILFREQMTSNTVYRKAFLHEHILLIPRSDLAWWYHRTGRIMKLGFAICGGAWALVNGHSLFLGIIVGSLIAGVNVHLMYCIMGIKPIFRYAESFPLVKEYKENGFYSGSQAKDGLVLWKFWDFFKSLFS
ncbi:hypothetical protein BH11BAC2_BH11BAC2_02950 [soil metagenome]